MRKNYCYLLLLFCLTHFTFGQVGVGTTTPNGAFEVNSSTQGLVMPRVSLTASNVAAPVVNPNGGALLTGTMVYNTATAGSSPNNVIPGFYFWDGSKWVLISSQVNPSNPDWSIAGNAGTTAGTHFVGTTDAVDFVTKTNNTERVRVKATGEVGIGTTAPSGKLDVTDNNPSGLTRSRFYNAGATSRQDINIGASGAGNLYLGTDATGAIFGAGIKGYLDNRSGGRMVLGTNGNENFTVATNGNVGVGVSVPSEKLDVVGNVKMSGALMPNNSAGVAGEFLQSAGPNSPPLWKHSDFNSAETNVLTIASAASQNFTIGIGGNWNEAMRLIVSSGNGCGYSMMDEYLLTGSNANNSWQIGGILGLGGNGATTTFTQVNAKTISVTRSGLVGCADGSNSTGHNYTINVSSGVVTITNNGNVSKTYRVKVIDYN